jgi:autotransporter translocation and assembly factor TamB
MGKRELLLIGAFVLLGAVVYQVAAPAGQGRQGGFSLSRMMDHLRREIRANSAEAEVSTETTIPLERGAAEVRVQSIARLTITGENRHDIAARLQVHSTGVDEADAKTLAEHSVLMVDQTGGVVSLKVDYPTEGQQRGELTLKIPKALAVRLEGTSGRVDVTEVGALYLNGTRGEVMAAKLGGELRGTFQGGRLRVDGTTGAVKLTARRAEIEIDKVSGDAAFDLSGGSLRATAIGGRLELDLNRVDVEIDDVGGAVRVNAAEGTLDLGGLKREARLDGRGTEMVLQLARPAPITAFTSDETLTLRLPPGGVTLDATTTAGDIRLPDQSLTVQEQRDERRARGPIRGGGPMVSLRVTRGDIVIR